MLRRPFLFVLCTLALGITVSACSGTPASMRSKMQSWASAQGYVNADATVHQDLVGIAAGIRLRDFNGLRTDCVGFSTDLDQIYGGLPAPDRTVTNEVNIALTKFWEPGAEQCYEARAYSDPRIAAFRRDLRLGEALFAKAESRIRSYGIH